MVTRKTGRPAIKPATQPGRTTRIVTRRARSHSLAPEHIGEAGSIALLALTILGLAMFIGAVAMIASGLTMGARFEGDPPPNLSELGVGQVVGGIGLLVLGIGHVGSALAVLADVRGSRLVAAFLSAATALLAAIGVLIIMAQPVASPILASALAVATVLFAAAAIILVRRRTA